MIDSFRALQTYAADPETFRGFLYELAGRLSALPITSFWVGEYNSTDTSDAPEFAVADAIVSLGTEREAERDRRVLSVVKLRGSSSLSVQRFAVGNPIVRPRLSPSTIVPSTEY